MIVLLALLVGICACDKDSLGVYQPKMKIFQIYSETDGHYLQEQWYWQGDLLSKIDYYRKNGNIDYSQTYSYEKNRLVRITSDNLHSEFTYDGNMLTDIKTYSGDQLLESYSFSYDKKKLSHLTINKSGKSSKNATVLNNIIPYYEDLVTVSAKYAEEKGISTNFSTADIDFIWSDGDIQNMKATLDYQSTVKHLVFTYIYDNNTNPRYNFLSMSVDQQLISDNPNCLFFNKHNVTGMYISDPDAPAHTGTQSYYYSYDYYKNYPTKIYSTFMSIDHTTGMYIPDSTLMYTYHYQ